MAYDAARQEAVLFGGYDGSDFFPDTWTWDGSTWTEESPGTFPSSRSSMGMVFDRSRRRIVLFGGLAGGLALRDTWTWDGTEWTRRALATLV